mmetsp:Transcript_48364/g.114212  ORF Transcript_48364/g.114212 Transcript_48364/m.114212 type:complete len:263 (+) Transcript_48364:1165-1953(+)
MNWSGSLRLSASRRSHARAAAPSSSASIATRQSWSIPTRLHPNWWSRSMVISSITKALRSDGLSASSTTWQSKRSLSCTSWFVLLRPSNISSFSKSNGSFSRAAESSYPVMVPTLRLSPVQQNHDTRRRTRFCPLILIPLCTTSRPLICIRPRGWSVLVRLLISPKSASKQLKPCFPRRGSSAPQTSSEKARAVTASFNASPLSASTRSHLQQTSVGTHRHSSSRIWKVTVRSVRSSASTWMKRRSSRRIHLAASCSFVCCR